MPKKSKNQFDSNAFMGFPTDSREGAMVMMEDYLNRFIDDPNYEVIMQMCDVFTEFGQCMTTLGYQTALDGDNPEKDVELINYSLYRSVELTNAFRVLLVKHLTQEGDPYAPHSSVVKQQGEHHYGKISIPDNLEGLTPMFLANVAFCIEHPDQVKEQTKEALITRLLDLSERIEEINKITEVKFR